MRKPGFAILVLVIVIFIIPVNGLQISHTPVFSGESAYNFLLDQCDFGPRPPGSQNLSNCRAFMAETLESFGWNVLLQNFTYLDVNCSNVIATWGTSNAPIILGAHFDTRPRATSDSAENQSKPILGANDGASGTAVLLELARILPESVRSNVELVFFDAEDSGGINGWDWIQGSKYYVSQLSVSRKDTINAMILVDMVGDANLKLPREASSTDSLQNEIWNIAKFLNYNSTFLESGGSSVLRSFKPPPVAHETRCQKFLHVGVHEIVPCLSEPPCLKS